MLKRTPLTTSALVLVALGLLVGCDKGNSGNGGNPGKTPAGQSGWTLKKLGEVPGMAEPECVVFDAVRHCAYVSNIQLTRENGHWDDDNKAFIARLVDGKADPLKFKEGTDKVRLSSPKGLCVVGDKLYVADIKRVTAYDLAGQAEPVVVEPPGAQGLNDMASDGRDAYVSDYKGGKIFRIRDGKAELVQSLPEINGITFAGGGKLFAVTWETHDVFELDPAGRAGPKPFGLARHFKLLDGVEVLDDGTFLITDNGAGKIFAVSADRKTVTLLAEGLAQPSDFALDRKKNVLYLPEMEANKVSIWQLEKK